MLKRFDIPNRINLSNSLWPLIRLSLFYNYRNPQPFSLPFFFLIASQNVRARLVKHLKLKFLKILPFGHFFRTILTGPLPSMSIFSQAPKSQFPEKLPSQWQIGLANSGSHRVGKNLMEKHRVEKLIN